MASPSVLPPAATAAEQPEPSDRWLVEQLREQRRAADRARLSALLTGHPLPRPRA